MPLAYVEHYTVDDYDLWEGDWELIEGMPYAMAPSPMVTHQSINMKIARQLDERLDECEECQALFEIDWYVSSDTVVRPDTLVICYEPDEKLTKKPEVIFEVTSPSTVAKDEKVKFEIYEREGVRYYILVYPDDKVAKVYELKDGAYIKMGDFSEEKTVFDLPSCQLEFDFSRIWRVKKQN
jgi:Uma2 family endonuclease